MHFSMGDCLLSNYKSLKIESSKFYKTKQILLNFAVNICVQDYILNGLTVYCVTKNDGHYSI